ncbi:MAG: hypothetical protein C4538_07580 [Nitrospiraceae bacterium]|nr:MAG: hypothetical protein C4538_07580 [Nitrospiraceae bacterium]
MSGRKKAIRYEAGGRDMKCPICGHEEFWKRKTLMNTKGLTFWELDWLNKEADNYVCDRCGYILWFLPK